MADDAESRSVAKINTTVNLFMRPPQRELKFHIQRTRHGIRAIRRDFLKAHAPVERDRIFHDGLDGIQANEAIAHWAGLLADSFCQCAPEAFAAECRANIDALHPSNVGLQRSQW